MYRDTHSFSAALRSALREDPDVILVGEMRDLETIRLAMTAAETGHLVFATLHTSSATKTINRVIDVFPGDEKAMIRSMLSGSLQAVVAQTLLKRPNEGRVVALEIMRCTSAIRSMIREDKIAQMYSSIQTGKAVGMQTLLKEGAISRETATSVALNKDILQFFPHTACIKLSAWRKFTLKNFLNLSLNVFSATATPIFGTTLATACVRTGNSRLLMINTLTTTVLIRKRRWCKYK